mgnify:CR=1 FL=1
MVDDFDNQTSKDYMALGGKTRTSNFRNSNGSIKNSDKSNDYGNNKIVDDFSSFA